MSAETSTPAKGRVAATFLPVERRTSADLPYDAFLREFVHRNRPVVVSNSIDAWPAMTRWTPEYFKSRFGSKMVNISYDKVMRFDDFIDGVLASTEEKPGPYMYRLFLYEHLREVLDDVTPQNPYAFPRRYASPLMLAAWRRPDGYLKLLIGGVGGKFPFMHFDGDNAHATITEVYGDKEFILYAPEDGAYLYPRADLENQSQVDNPRNQDLERFPLLAKATQYRTVLKPGDTVFVPARWWHTARALTPSISTCTNIVDRSNWDGYVSWIAAPTRGRSPARQRMKKAYLSVLGRVLSAVEDVQDRAPGIAKRLGLPEISPVDSVVARDPATTDWTIKVPTG
jgi:hypothetical protein